MTTPAEWPTVRLRLRQWRASDRAPFAELNADPRVMEFFPAPLTRAQSDAMVDRWEALIDARGWGFWAVELEESGGFIGFVGLHNPSGDLPFSPCTEIGWRLAFDHWGRGYATEAARAAGTWTLDAHPIDQLQSLVDTDNTRSQAVTRRLGMQPASETLHAGTPHVICRIDRSDWMAVHR